MKLEIKPERLDQLGMTASIACAIHCAALPLVATALPLVGLEFLAHTWVEIVMITLSLIIGTWSMIGTFRQHQSIAPTLILVAGFMMFFMGHFLWHELEAILVTLGGFTIAGAHFLNWKLVRACAHIHSSTKRDENE